MWAVLAVIVVVGGATIGFLTWANQSRAEPIITVALTFDRIDP